MAGRLSTQGTDSRSAAAKKLFDEAVIEASANGNKLAETLAEWYQSKEPSAREKLTKMRLGSLTRLADGSSDVLLPDTRQRATVTSIPSRASFNEFDESFISPTLLQKGAQRSMAGEFSP